MKYLISFHQLSTKIGNIGVDRLLTSDHPFDWEIRINTLNTGTLTVKVLGWTEITEEEAIKFNELWKYQL